MKKAVFLVNLVAISSNVFGMFNDYQYFSQNKYNQYAELNENCEDDQNQYKTWDVNNEIIYDYGAEPNESSEIDRLKAELREYKEQCASLYGENQRLKKTQNQNNVVQENYNKHQKREQKKKKFFEKIKAGNLNYIEQNATPFLVKTTDENGNTPVHIAINEENFDIAWFLISKFKCINLQNEKGETPLLFALKRNYTNEPLVQHLLNYRYTNVNISDNEGISPILLCINNGDFNTAWKLVLNGAEVDKRKEGSVKKEYISLYKDCRKYFEIFQTLKEGNYEEFVKLSKGSRKNEKHLIYTLPRFFSEVLEGRENINYRLKKGDTALITASRYRLFHLAEELIKKGADIDVQNNEGFSALINAAKNGDFALVKLLVKNNANLNLRTTDGNTALLMALRCGYRNIANYLIDRKYIGADLENKKGETPLLLAIKFADTELIYKLLARGANLKKVNPDCIKGSESICLYNDLKKAGYPGNKNTQNRDRFVSNKFQNSRKRNRGSLETNQGSTGIQIAGAANKRGRWK